MELVLRRGGGGGGEVEVERWRWRGGEEGVGMVVAKGSAYVRVKCGSIM